MTNGEKYDATAIKVLGGIEAVRKRPAMYIGDTAPRPAPPGRGSRRQLHRRGDGRLLQDASTSTINADGSVTVTDDGRGIPVDMHKEMKRPALEVVLTMLHAGGKFDHTSLQGLRRPARRGRLGRQRPLRVARGRGPPRRQGLPPGVRARQRRQRAQRRRQDQEDRHQGHLQARHEIFPDTMFSYEMLLTRLRELAFLNRRTSASASKDERDGREETFQFDRRHQGVRQVPQRRQRAAAPRHHLLREGGQRHHRRGRPLQYNDGYNETSCPSPTTSTRTRAART